MLMICLLLLGFQEPRETTSLLGEPLYRPELSPARRADYTRKLADARDHLAEHQDDPLAHIWVGRRLAYLGRYRDAVASYTRSLERFPDEARLYRHRGHRYITLRQFDKAVADLRRAAELTLGKPDRVEPDGMPNAAGIPTSTTQTNIYYHLGLAYYLQGKFEPALDAYKKCLDLSKNNDMMVATLDWMYMTLRRLKRDDEARRILEPVTADMKLLESFSYHRRLLMYKGEVNPEALLKPVDEEADPLLAFATQGYGVGNYYLSNGKSERAVDVFHKVLESGYWSAFGYIAAEADLKALGYGKDPWTVAMFQNFQAGKPVTEAFKGSMKEAERARSDFVRLLGDSQGRIMGYKAALTSPPAQKQFGVNAPLFGMLMEGMLVPEGTTLPRNFGTRILFEGDLLVRVKDPGLIHAQTREAALAGLDAAYPLLELPDMVYGPGVKLNGPALVAVNAGGRKAVVGKAVYLRGDENWADRLADFKLTITDETGKILSRGAGNALLGHPLDAVLWLCGALKQQGLTLKKGDLLSLGSVTRLLPLTDQKTLTARYEGLHPEKDLTVTIHFSGGEKP
ncbi:MAG: tetratricopeptide repeat protein [Acidobacteriota bacterium]|nr:tetratricopeptide repeat protein [Acidobacteriota bacterium]